MQIVFWTSAFILDILNVVSISYIVLSGLRTKSQIQRVLFIFLTGSLISDCLGYLFSYHNYSNFPILNIYTCFEFIVLSFMFKSLFSIKPSKFFIILLLIYFSIFLFRYANALQQNAFIPPIFESATLVLLSILYFFKCIPPLNYILT